MGIYLMQIQLQGASGTPDDRYVNTLWFDSGVDVPTQTDFEDLADAAENFYMADYSLAGQTARVQTYLSYMVAQNNHVTRIYEGDTPPPNLPLYSRTWNLSSAPAGGDLPPEVAFCISFKGTIPAGSNTGPGPHLPARHRGRIYFGPIDGLAATINGADGTRPKTVFMDDLLIGAARAFSVDLATTIWDHIVWSRVNEAGDPVLEYWADNEYDTQRRRSLAPNARRFQSA